MRVLLIPLTLLIFSASAMAQPPPHAPAHGARGMHGHGHGHGEAAPMVDANEIRQVFGRHEWTRADQLPPGIRKNLARGKPLPPGIAKRVEGPLARDLPYYPGYEWTVAGEDALLIDSATRVIVDIIDNVLR
jgi:Ni/Co efflux regulator RcnB